MTVSFTDVATLQIGTPRVHYDVRFRETINSNTPHGVARDGRFLRVQPSNPDYAVTSINVMLNLGKKALVLFHIPSLVNLKKPRSLVRTVCTESSPVLDGGQCRRCGARAQFSALPYG